MSFVARRGNTLVLAICVLIALPVVTRNAVWTDSAALLGIYALLALSVGLSYGQAGILTLSQAAFASLGAYAAAICTVRWGWPPLADLPVALLLPALIAFPVARLVARLSPLATALSTLAIGSIIAIAIRSADDFTGGYMGIAGVPSIGFVKAPASYAWLIWAMVVIVVFLYENLCHSAYGRALNVLRFDQARAAADGVNPPMLVSAAFAISSSIAGVSGWLYAHYISFVSPESLDAHLSISALLMAVVGGAEFILGPILGTLLLDGLTRLLPAAELQGVYYGIALIVILLVARRGIFGLIEGGLAQVRQLRRSRSGEVTALEIEASRP
ncbi:branched-chain amino acid ABC transporter permease [Bradyrhizobium jicamae]|uniref:branched-chain amino acid ABC transporter permease n=1 Tax=Bradyrhizobium jicamae TaxID=280332 RepID=UPI001BABC723|nr:branched-chain amino acid ABC transporter permease [Bradyrhizobium jicamae]MBR0934353.1 branched-chain amino acid ABC transporter permease [Bradyrhizobium jicamae]